jgi:hypothetical protein
MRCKGCQITRQITLLKLIKLNICEFSCQCAPAAAYVSLYLPLTASLSLEQAAEKITAAMPSFTDLW